jgi:hypothetical protein
MWSGANCGGMVTRFVTQFPKVSQHAAVMLHQPESLRFSTDSVPRRDRLKAVRELRDRGILPIEPLPDRVR